MCACVREGVWRDCLPCPPCSPTRIVHLLPHGPARQRGTAATRRRSAYHTAPGSASTAMLAWPGKRQRAGSRAGRPPPEASRMVPRAGIHTGRAPAGLVDLEVLFERRGRSDCRRMARLDGSLPASWRGGWDTGHNMEWGQGGGWMGHGVGGDEWADVAAAFLGGAGTVLRPLLSGEALILPSSRICGALPTGTRRHVWYPRPARRRPPLVQPI